jgi:hypothetical protein
MKSIERIQSKNIERTQSECLKMPKEINQLIVEVEKSKRNLDKLINNFYTIEKSQKCLIVLNDDLIKVLEEYKDYDLTLSFNKYSFDLKKIDFKDSFGNFSETENGSGKLIYLF